MTGFVYRGPNTFRFKRKRWPLFSLRTEMAFKRLCHPGGGGGSFSGETGDGEAWHKNSDRFGKWFRVRAIKAGQWAGPWRYQHVDDI